MKSLRKWLRILSYYIGPVDKFYTDKVPSTHFTTDQIPDVIFERDVLMYNCGYRTKYKDYMVIVGKRQSELFQWVGKNLKVTKN